MQLDECLKLPATPRRDRARDASCRCAGRERCKRAFEARAREATRCSASCRAATTGLARAERAGAHRHRLRRLRHRRPRGRRAAGRDARDRRRRRRRRCRRTGRATSWASARRDDLLEAVARGIDMFDCVLPTRNGRHGPAFTRFGPINLGNARHADDPRPLDEQSAHPGRARPIRAPICIIWSRPTRCWAGCCCPRSISPITRS